MNASPNSTLPPSDTLLSSPPPKNGSRESGRILVVEDEPTLSSLSVRVLGDAGWDVRAAGDARQARALLLERPADLVLLDLHLPGEMSGIELFRWVRSECPGVDVVLMTGSPSLDTALEAFRFGAVDYLLKPVDQDHLRQVVARCLERRRAASELQTEKQLREALEKTYRELSAMDGMRDTFRRYLTKEVADKVLACPTPEGVQAERRQMSILFADIRRFTPFAESRPAEETIQVLNSVFERLNPVVSRFGGIISKFTGDGMMVLFGAPLAQPDHAERAAECALEMQAEMKRWNSERVRCGAQPLQLGVGVASGDAVAGSLGSIERTEYTVIGSTVNLAARLEERAGAGQILVSALTAASVADRCQLRSQGLVWVDGFSKSLTVFELLPSPQP